VLLKLNGMTKGSAAKITGLLLKKARALPEQEKRSKLGIISG
jgi:hypothetical protein